MRTAHSDPGNPVSAVVTATLALLLAGGLGSALAQGLVRQAPEAARQAQALAAPPAVGATDPSVAVPGLGLVRVAKPGTTASAPQATGPKGIGTRWVSPTQAMRVAPDQPAMVGVAPAEGAPALARVASTDPALQVRQVGTVQLLERRGQAPVLLGAPGASADAALASTPAALRPGVQVVVLPPGAVLPDGPPAPLTLYRPAAAREAAAAAVSR